MNKKGQTLVIFVIILPIIIMLFAYIFDSSMLYLENRNLTKLKEEAVEYLNSGMEKEKITEFIKANDKKIKINIKDNDIILKKEIGSVFGRIIGKTTYKIES